jgi:hypothetical protein
MSNSVSAGSRFSAGGIAAWTGVVSASSAARAHPRTALEANGRFVRSSAFTRQGVLNAPSRLKAELQTEAGLWEIRQEMRVVMLY